MRIYFNPIFNIETKKSNQKHRLTDYNWLYGESLDKRTTKNIKKIIEAREKFLKKGRYPFIGKEIVLNLKKCPIVVISNRPYSSIIVYKEIFIDNEHQKNKDFEESGKHLIDIGANQGLYTIKMCLRDKNVNAVCVEPGKDAFRLLKRNIKINNLTKRVKIVNAAVWSNNEPQTLLALPGVTSNASLVNSPSHSPWLSKSIVRKEKIRSLTLDQIYEISHFKKIDTLKIDTEGSEAEIIKSGDKALENTEKVVIEYHSEELRQNVISKMKSKGFNILKETRDEKLNMVSGNLYFSK